MSAALPILIVFFAASIGLGLWSRRGREMDLEQWSVGGRGFGGIIVFLLLAGEIYTTFTFLGASGYAYSYGGASFYILCYGALAYVFSYWLAPAIWRYGSKEKLVSQADWFSRKYGSRNLSLIVTLLGLVAMIPYLELQLTGLGIIIEETSYGAVPRSAAIILGAVALAVYVAISGIHSAAANAVVKDILVLIVVVFLGIYLPVHYFGSIGSLLDRVETTKPAFLALTQPSHDTGWFITSVLLSALGFFMWPHYFSATYSSKDERTFRRNSMILPVYQLVLLFVIFTGLTALIVVPGLSNGDLSLLRVARDALPSGVVGLVGAAGLFCALVPGSMLLTTSATMLAKNVFAELKPQASFAPDRGRGPDRRPGDHRDRPDPGLPGRLGHRQPAAARLRLRHPAVPVGDHELPPGQPDHQVRRRGRHRGRRSGRGLAHPRRLHRRRGAAVPAQLARPPQRRGDRPDRQHRRHPGRVGADQERSAGADRGGRATAGRRGQHRRELSPGGPTWARRRLDVGPTSAPSPGAQRRVTARSSSSGRRCGGRRTAG